MSLTSGKISQPQWERLREGGWLSRADAKRAKGDLDGAIAEYTQAIEFLPDLAPLWASRAECKKANGDHIGAVADRERFLALDDNDRKSREPTGERISQFPPPERQANSESAIPGGTKSRNGTGPSKAIVRFAIFVLIVGVGVASFYMTGMSDAVGGQRLRAFFGSVDARNALAWRYREGRGVPLDFSEAAILFEKAGNSGSAKAQYDLGILYYYGLGVAEKSDTAGNWFERAAQQDYPPAVSMLGLIAANDQHDTRKAMELWQRAVLLKDVWAEYLLGLAYLNLSSTTEDNQTIERNRTRALFWLEKGRRDGVEPIGGLLQQVWMMVPDESVERVKGEVYHALEKGIAP